MSQIRGLRVLVKQFLSVAADEIMEAVEKIIAGYEEEMFQYRRDIRSNRLSEEAQRHLSVGEEDLIEQQQEWNSSMRRKNPESLQIERMHNEPLSSMSSSPDKRSHDDPIHDIFTSHSDKNEHEMYKVEEEPLPVTSAPRMITVTDEGVPSPVLSEAENGFDDDWNATHGDSDRSEEWTPSGQHHTLTGSPQTKQKLKSRIICKVCEKSFNSELSLVKHLQVHPKDVCSLCGMMHFKTEVDFNLHLKTHLKAKVCDICGKSFARPSYLKEHMRSHTGVKPFRCKECGRYFSRHQNMTRHLRTHAGDKS